MNISNSIASTVTDLQPYALKLTHDMDEASDLIQETAFKALKSQKNYKEGTNLKGWLYTIMRNTFINQYRSKSRRNTWSEPNENMAQYSDIANTNDVETQICLDDMLTEVNKLADDLRIPITMLYQGFKYHEIATQLSIPVGTVKSRVFVARKLMREILQAYRLN